MKKILSILMISVLSFSIVGCKTENEAPETNVDVETPAADEDVDVDVDTNDPDTDVDVDVK